MCISPFKNNNNIISYDTKEINKNQIRKSGPKQWCFSNTGLLVYVKGSLADPAFVEIKNKEINQYLPWTNIILAASPCNYTK